MIETPDCTSYDLTSPDDVLKLGELLGREFARDVTPLLRRMPPEVRVVFFAALLGGPAGCMGAAVGDEAAITVLDTLKGLVQQVADAERARLN